VPELPEVETVVRDLCDAGLVGRRIEYARVYWPRTISGLTPRTFSSRVKHQRIRHIRRRGKFIVIELSGGRTLLVHLRMTGQFALLQHGVRRDKHQHVLVGLDDGRELRFRDPRKFGRWTLLDDAEDKLGALGPEPLDDAFTSRVLSGLLTSRSRMLKPLLLDQHVIAGLGNIYVDEALWDARVHPCRNSGEISPEECARLYRSIRKVLRRGVRAMGTTLGRGSTNFYSVAGRRGRNKDGLKIFRRTGEPCPRCRTPIERMLIAQRSSHVCPRCQAPA